MIDIAFIILNYNSYTETIKCVESIRERIDTKEYHIVIVDNGSTNNSVDKLKGLYVGNDDISIIALTDNIGFAKGNNVGIEQARRKGAQFVCCINDDASIVSTDFYNVIQSKCNEYNVAVIGPTVIQGNGKKATFNHKFETIEYHKKRLEKLEREQYKESYVGRLKNFIVGCPSLAAVGYLVKNKLLMNETKEENDTLDLVLQGSCVVFTPLFFEHLSGFNSATFLYMEEDFLMADLMINGLHSLYCPQLCVFHKGGVSTLSITGRERRKRWEFAHKHLLNSYREFVSYIEENEEAIYHAKKKL